MTSDRRPDSRLGLDRRALLKSSAGAAAITAASIPWLGPWLGRSAFAQSDFDWRQFEGEQIEVLHTKNPRADLLQQYEPEFTELTGIEVGSEQVPEQQQRQKQVIEFTSGGTSFDVTDVSWHVQKRLFGKGKWLEDLRPYLDNAALTPATYDFDDFSNAGITYATQADGRIDTLPAFIDYWIVYWNKELFDAKSIAYPTTYRRAARGREGAARPGERRLWLGEPGAQERQHPGLDQPAARLGHGFGERAGRAADHHGGSDPGGRDLHRAQRPVRSAGRRAASTGTNASRTSCRATSPCGSTASASRRRSRTRPSRAWSARSATA